MRVLTLRSKNRFFVVRMIVYSLKVIGLAPFSIARLKIPCELNPRHGLIQVFKSSKIGLAYNLLILVSILSFAAFWTLPKRLAANKSAKTSRSSAEIILYVLEYVIKISTVCLILVSWGSRQKHASSIMNRLLEVDFRLSRFAGQPFSKRTIVFLIIHVIVSACLWTTIWSTAISYADYHSFFISFADSIPDTIVYWFMLEYSAIVSLVARDLQTVNYHLVELKETRDDLTRPPLQNSRLIITGSPIHYSGQLASLKLLRSVRTTICEICEDIDGFFSLPILCCFACCFFPLFRQLYALATFQKHDLGVAVMAFVTYEVILMYVYPVISLALNASQIGNEAALTAHILHKSMAGEKRREIKAELEEFSRQLLHEDVSFTAYGFFSIDSTTIAAILSGTATYFIVLMQYEEQPICECENNSTVDSVISNSTFPTTT